jgi:hypothetical protein
MADLFEFPPYASGLFVTGSSMANMIALLVARRRALGREVRSHGVPPKRQAVAYASAGAHGCIAQAMDLAGLGSANLRKIPMNAQFQMDTSALEAAITADRQAGLQPFFIAATAGTVDVGAIDEMPVVAAIAERNGLWFHVDGAYGALAALSPELRPRWRALSWPTPSPAISTNGGRCRTTPVLSWCATAGCTSTPSPPARPICAATNAAWRPIRRGRAISDRICRAASVRSRPGSPSRSTAPSVSGK